MSRRVIVILCLGAVVVLAIGIGIGLAIGSRSESATPATASTTVTTASTLASGVDRNAVIDGCVKQGGPTDTSLCPRLVDTILAIVARLGYRCTTAQLTQFVLDDANSRFPAEKFTDVLKSTCAA